MSRYTFQIVTADEASAGTDANIFLTMHGTNGTSPEIRINPFISGNAFERGSVDVFSLSEQDVTDLGEIYELTVRSDNRGPGADWKLAHIRIFNNVVSGDPPSAFSYNRWFTPRDAIQTRVRDQGIPAICINAQQARQREEVEGIDLIVFDNRASDTAAVGREMVIKAYKRTTRFSRTNSVASGVSVGANASLTLGGLRFGATVTQKMQEAFREMFELGSEGPATQAREFNVEAPPGTVAVARIEWRRTVQAGRIDYGAEHVAYEVVLRGLRSFLETASFTNPDDATGDVREALIRDGVLSA